MSLPSSDGLSMNVSAPIVKGGEFMVAHSSLSGYSHEMSTEHGFDNAQVDLAMTARELPDWMTNGLGRDVSMRSPAGTTIWDGFVNQVTISQGYRNIVIGPLTDLGNRVAVLFTEQDNLMVPATAGVLT